MKKLPPITGETADLVALLGEDRQGAGLPIAQRRKLIRRYQLLLATHEDINQTIIADLAAFRARRITKGTGQ